MNPTELANVLNAFLLVQRQMIMTFDTFFNDMRRIPQVPCDTRHKIRQIAYFRMIHKSDLVCQQSTRMDRRCFAILYHLLQTTTVLESTDAVDVEEIVTIFLHVLSHDVKNREVQRDFVRSSETASRHFNIVLMVVLRLSDELLAKSQLVPSDYTNPKWQCFEVRCLKFGFIILTDSRLSWVIVNGRFIIRCRISLVSLTTHT